MNKKLKIVFILSLVSLRSIAQEESLVTEKIQFSLKEAIDYGLERHESIKNEMYWFPIKKEGEARANKAFLTIPKIYSKPNFENQFFVNDYNSLLKEVWSTYTELKKEGTSPVVYAPELWREYEKKCIRLEVLKKIGADIETLVLSRAVNCHLQSQIIVSGNKAIVFPEAGE